MEQNHYNIFDEMLEGVQVIDQDFRYYYVNKTVAKQGKTTIEELLGRTIMEKYPGIEKTQMFELIKKCMQDRTPHKLLNEFDFPDKSKGYFELRIQPVPEGVLILSLDVTEQKKLEQELRIVNECLEEVVNDRTKELINSLDREKALNDIKSNFVSTASHEFKTPLGSIEICVNVLEKYNTPPKTKERKKFHENIRTSVKELHQIIDDYLTIDKIQEESIYYHIQKFDLPENIRSEIKKLSLTCKPNQKINYNHEGEKEMLVDVQIFRSIINNLISNAIKYSSKDIELCTCIKNEKLTLEVIDEGIGIPEDEQKKLFKKFYRATNVKDISGSGLGLNIVKRYVELLNGKIKMTSKPGKTVFKVEMPQKIETDHYRDNLKTHHN